jgi:hypothetical protein
MMPLGALAALLLAALLAAATYAWLLAGGVFWRPRQVGRRGQDVQAAFRRHPAARSRDTEYFEPARPAAREGAPHARRPLGPDDDPEFINALARMIRGGGPDA